MKCIKIFSSIEFKYPNNTILSINITEPELEPDVDYSKAAVPFLAFGMKGSVTSVAKPLYLF